MSRRERLQPEDVGLPRGTRRRVAGLRREEVSTLAGVSLDYYVQIERGEVGGVSDEVLAAVARALRLEDAERQHLFDLARGQNSRRPPRAASVRVPSSLQSLLDAMTAAPAVLQTGALEIVAANALGRALYQSVFASQETPNLARYVYCEPAAKEFFDDWDAIADEVAAMLRTETARNPSHQLQSLVAELEEKSKPFAHRWAAHDVADHRRGRKVLHHPEVGELRLRYEALEVVGMPGTRLFGYTADPDSPETRDRLHLLGMVSSTESIGLRH